MLRVPWYSTLFVFLPALIILMSHEMRKITSGGHGEIYYFLAGVPNLQDLMPDDLRADILILRK